MPWAAKYSVKHESVLRDVRPLGVRIADDFSDTFVSTAVFVFAAIAIVFIPTVSDFSDVLAFLGALYLRWLQKRKFELPLKLPMNATRKDPHNTPLGQSSGSGKPEGILFLGNDRATGDECWLSDSDARTHILFLGTTGAGKTEGLKAIVTNSLTWGSGFVYVDGKADTDLWASLFSLARRFGRDDDLLVLNYMTGNSDRSAPSNSMNPFSSGSASYLVQMLVSLMPEAGGDNAMWKERAVALISALMPALTFKRDRQGMLLDIGTVRDNIELPAIIRLSRDPNLPERIIRGLQSYLATLPGYVDAAFDDDGNERPPSPDSPVYDLSVARQQHGYLSMQFTRSLQSLADDYGYIFKAQLADIDIIDVVLNRRILAVLIPALEKSGDEAANLGKIVAACIKGMMGSTLGSNVEGSWETTVENKAARAPSPYITVFDEVGYYTAQGMAVMAAQARSLGFSLVFAAQDLPSMEKRVREEARSITGNCNLKIFGKLEDPTGTKEFFEKTIGGDYVMESASAQMRPDSLNTSYFAQPNASLQTRNRSSYDSLKKQRQGQVHFLFAQYMVIANMFYPSTDRVRALRVQKLLPVPPTTATTTARDKIIGELSTRLKDKDWTVEQAGTNPVSGHEELAAAAAIFARAKKAKKKSEVAAMMSIGTMALRLAGEETLPVVAGDHKANGKDAAPMAAMAQDDEDVWLPEPPASMSAFAAKPTAAQAAKAPPAAAAKAAPSTATRATDIGTANPLSERDINLSDDAARMASGNGHGNGASDHLAGDDHSDPRLLATLVRDSDLTAQATKTGKSKKNSSDNSLIVPPDIAAILSAAADKLVRGLFTRDE